MAERTAELRPQRRLIAEREREKAEGSFRLLVEGVVDYAIYMLDPSGMITNWNAGAERIKGYRSSEIIGQHFSRFFTDEDRAAGLPATALETAAREGKYEAEGWRVRKDGTRFWASVVIDADPRQERHADRLRQDHARHHGAPRGQLALQRRRSSSRRRRRWRASAS